MENKSFFYYLDGTQPKKASSVEEWAQKMESTNRIVKQTKILDVTVLTVFLGTDYELGCGVPILFETMIFGGEYDLYVERYSTWGEAVEGHRLACEKVVE